MNKGHYHWRQGRRDFFGGNLQQRGADVNYPGANGTGWQEAHDYGERALQYHQSLHDG